MVGHLRWFTACFAYLARPFNKHLEEDAVKLKAHKVVLSRKAKEAFNLLKRAIIQAPVLKFADYSKLFVLKTDATVKTTVVVVLKAYRRKAIDGCHWDAGYQGQNRTACLLLERFWWPSMMIEVKNAVKRCE